MAMRDTMHKQRGFTLLELMIVVTIAGIMIMLALPAFTEMIKNNRMTTTVNEFIAQLSLARTEAIKRGVSVQVCTSNNQTSCTVSSWDDGYITWSDTNNNGAVDATEVIRVTQALNDANFTITSGQFVNTITYLSTAFVNVAGTFHFCDDRATVDGKLTKAKGVIVNLVGRPRVTIKPAAAGNLDDTNGNGILEDIGGNDLTCP